MRDKKQVEDISEQELLELFNNAETVEEKVKIYSRLQDEDKKMELLYSIPEKDRYKFIGKLKIPQNIALALDSFNDDKAREKTFNFVAKQLKGNSKRLLEIASMINFRTTLPTNMLTFTLNNLNVLNLDFLINIKNNIENFAQMKFKVNEEDDSRDIEYSFGEISAIIGKIEELTADIPKDTDEANKFYTIYSRLTRMTTYDHECIRMSHDARDRLRNKKNYGGREYNTYIKDIRKKAAGLYGGLVEGKAICAGYALILHQALLYTGIKSQYVCVHSIEGNGHAWNQIQIDGKWYNADPTWDSSTIQMQKKYKYMLLNDKVFEESHSKYSIGRTKTYHQCKSIFDYSKIKGYSFDRGEEK